MAAAVEASTVSADAKFELVYLESAGAGCAERRVPLVVGWSARFESGVSVTTDP